MAKQCILYEDKLCDNCGECERCDLDPSKLCDNCGRCMEAGESSEFRSIIVKNAEASDNADDGGADEMIDAFLDEPLDLETPEEIPVAPELLAKWESILNESFKSSPANPPDDEPVLHAVRRRRVRNAGRGGEVK